MQIIFGFKTKFDRSAKMQLDDMPSFVRWEFHKDHELSNEKNPWDLLYTVDYTILPA